MLKSYIVWYLACWKPDFSLKIKSCMEEYQRVFIMVSAMHPHRNFWIRLWRRSISVEFRLATYSLFTMKFMYSLYTLESGDSGIVGICLDISILIYLKVVIAVHLCWMTFTSLKVIIQLYHWNPFRKQV